MVGVLEKKSQGPLKQGHSSRATQAGPLKQGHSSGATQAGPLKQRHSSRATQAGPLKQGHSSRATPAGHLKQGISSRASQTGHLKQGISSIEFNLKNPFYPPRKTALQQSIENVENFNYYEAMCNILFQPSLNEKCQKISNIFQNEILNEKFEICSFITKENCARYGSQDPNSIDSINHALGQVTVSEKSYSWLNSNSRTKSKNSYTSCTSDQATRKSSKVCPKIHFQPIIHYYTQTSLGQCSFLNLCHRKNTCKYIHYEVDGTLQQINYVEALEKVEKINFNTALQLAFKNGCLDNQNSRWLEKTNSLTAASCIDKNLSNWSHHANCTNLHEFTEPNLPSASHHAILPPQWIKADIRCLDFSILGEYNVILMDPPWDIHMDLPYGTMKDSEMSVMPIHQLASKSEPCLLFLWVTGRTKELASTLMKNWGFYQTDVLIWVKTNQLGHIVRTGRTGHWLNHGKEHCLVGVRGQIPQNFDTLLNSAGSHQNPYQNLGPGPNILNYFNSTNIHHAEYVTQQAIAKNFLKLGPYNLNDVIVSPVRETSRKPDELYEMIESICPEGRKIELFGRMHNLRKGWVTIGNQLEGIEIHDKNLLYRFLKKYPSCNANFAAN